MKRISFIKTLGAGILGSSVGLKSFAKIVDDLPETGSKMPLFFIGHGSPMNAIEINPFTNKLTLVGITLPRPNAILCISAHWLTNGSFVSGIENPDTIHDFYGFPEDLFKVQYPCPGAPYAANETVLLSGNKIVLDMKWGIDHGTWSVLKHLFPNADIPTFQLSIDYNNGLEYHFELGKTIKKLRDKGVLVIGSGNLVHNLIKVDFENKNAAPYDWALEFDSFVKARVETRNFKSLINYSQIGEAANKAHPTNDHYLPLLYVLGMCDTKEPIEFIYEAFEYRSVSMRCLKIG